MYGAEKGKGMAGACNSWHWLTARFIVLCLLVTLSWAFHAPSAGASAQESSFCKQPILRDYAPGINHLPEGHPPPSGELPFAPGLELSTIPSAEVVIAGTERVGFQLSAREQRRYRVDWTVVTRLQRVHDGKSASVVSVKSGRLDSASHLKDHPIQFGFIVPNKDATYRMSLVFKNGTGTVLHKYVVYVRTLKAIVDPRLELNADSYRAGEFLQMRVANLGTTSIEYGFDFTVERRTELGWIDDVSTPKGFILPGIPPVRAGYASRCAILALPSDMQPGRYRISKDVTAAQSGKRLTIFAPFVVSP